MAKSGPSKKRKGLSKHSREARRAGSPSLNTDPSLKALRTPENPTRASVLAARHDAGVLKRRKGGKAVERTAARRRHARAADMALSVLERTSHRLERNVGHARLIRARNRAWDEINHAASRHPAAAATATPAVRDGPGRALQFDLLSCSEGEDSDQEGCPANVPDASETIHEEVLYSADALEKLVISPHLETSQSEKPMENQDEGVIS